MKNYIAYCRVSTAGQGIGLDAQLATINAWCQNNNGTVIATYSEKESGKETINRPELNAAIAACRDSGATLIVAKLDRLSRDVADIFTLKRQSVPFEVCDIDASDTLILGIFATLAQKERELISRRTRDALAALKAKGVKLGNPHAADAMRAINHLGVARRRADADAATENRHAWNAIRLMNGTLAQRAAWLNAEGYRTRNGKLWTPCAVQRLAQRYAAQ